MPPSTPRIRPVALVTLVWAGMSLVATVAVVAWQWRKVDIPGLFPGPGLELTQANFPNGPRLVSEQTLRLSGTLDGITAVPTSQGHRILVFGRDRILSLGADLTAPAVRILPAVAQSFENIDGLELGPDKMVIAASNRRGILRRNSAVIAYDGDGNLAFAHIAPDRASVHGLALLRVGSSFAIAVSYGGRGLCLLDDNGTEKWCNAKVKGAWLVSTADCDQDGQDDILTNTSLAQERNELACYNLEGRQIHTIRVPFPPDIMAGVDLDGDGRKEIAYFFRESNQTHRFGAWRLDGEPFIEAHVADPTEDPSGVIEGGPPRSNRDRWPSHLIPFGARRGPDDKRDLVVLGPAGELLGLSQGGARWQVGQDILDAVAVDLDGDGGDELVTLGSRVRRHDFDTYAVSIWSWKRPGVPVRREFTLETAPRPTTKAEARSRVPIQPYATPTDGWGASTEELDFRHGCYMGTGRALRGLPARIVRQSVEGDLKRCEDALAALDVSNIYNGADLTAAGCLAGATLTLQKYTVPVASDRIETISRACLAEASGKQAETTDVDIAAHGNAAAESSIAPVWLPSTVATRLRHKADGSPVGEPPVPPELTSPSREYRGSYEVCVSAAGAITRAIARSPQERKLDALWLADIRASRFEPYRIFDTAIPFCAILRLHTGRDEILDPLGGDRIKLQLN